MTKEYYVKIVLDDSEVGESTTAHQGPGGSRFVVTVRPCQDNPADSLAHELGHVVSSIFNTEAVRNDPRTQPNMGMRDLYNKNHVSPKEVQAMVALETEAWDYAEMMRHVDPETREDALDSYRVMDRSKYRRW